MSTTLRRTALLTLPLVTLAAVACEDDGLTQPDLATTFETSFEEGTAGFTVDTDDLGDPPVTWSVERTTDFAETGEASMAIRIDNVNDQAKVWIEREIPDLEPNQAYVVDIAFEFGSSDWGTVNLWTLLVDAGATSPDTFEDFDDGLMGDTGNGASEDSGVLWTLKTGTVLAETNAEGSLHVAVGVWGTFEAVRDYYIDDLQVTATSTVAG